MAVLQTTQNELRYIKRQNLEQEASIIGNYYRDIIRSYGIDCKYYKLDTTEFENFKGTIDRNVLLKHAYGYNIVPDYKLSVNMLTYMEVENDIFQLQKFGLTPNVDVYFYFDSTDFACDLATKVGQFKEYKIKELNIECEVPECISDIYDVVDNSGNHISGYLSSEVFPYKLGLGYNEFYECEMLTGKLSVEIDGYDIDQSYDYALSQYTESKEYNVVCHPYEHTDFNVKFPSNKNLYESLKHVICNDDYIDTYIQLKYKICKVTDNGKDFKYILKGKISGSILFYDINSIGKYIERIHPMVGDIVTIDFPDETNREQYDIVDCFDKQLTTDGISPLLHKYIWKCKARRHVNSYDDVEQNEANARVEEKLKYDNMLKEEIGKNISIYDENEDAAYGGYDSNHNDYEHKKINPNAPTRYEFLDDNTAIDIIRFGCGSRLVTNGYDLIFVNSQHEAMNIVTKYFDYTIHDRLFESGLRWLKANDSCITFTDIDGTTTKIAEDFIVNENELDICLNSLYDKTKGPNINRNGDNFVKFTECKSYLWATESDLFAKIASSNELYKLT